MEVAPSTMDNELPKKRVRKPKASSEPLEDQEQVPPASKKPRVRRPSNADVIASNTALAERMQALQESMERNTQALLMKTAPAPPAPEAQVAPEVEPAPEVDRPALEVVPDSVNPEPIADEVVIFADENQDPESEDNFEEPEIEEGPIRLVNPLNITNALTILGSKYGKTEEFYKDRKGTPNSTLRNYSSQLNTVNALKLLPFLDDFARVKKAILENHKDEMPKCKAIHALFQSLNDSERIFLLEHYAARQPVLQQQMANLSDYKKVQLFNNVIDKPYGDLVKERVRKDKELSMSGTRPPTERQKKNYVKQEEILAFVRSVEEKSLQVFRTAKKQSCKDLFTHSVYTGIRIDHESGSHIRNDLASVRFRNYTRRDRIILHIPSKTIYARQLKKTKWRSAKVVIPDSIWPLVSALIECRKRLTLETGVQQDYLFHSDRMSAMRDDNFLRNADWGKAVTKRMRDHFGKNVSIQVQRTAMSVAGNRDGTLRSAKASSVRLNHTLDVEPVYIVAELDALRDAELAEQEDALAEEEAAEVEAFFETLEPGVGQDSDSDDGAFQDDDEEDSE